MTPAIELHDVTKRYGRFTAVDRLSLEVRPGELFAFLGPNGAGKTTTIKMIAGLLRPDAGIVRVCGRSMQADGTAARMMLSYVPDEPFLYDKLTAREFLTFVARMYRLPAATARARIDGLVERLEMGSFLDQLTEGFSHGMKQRTVLAAALLHEPAVLVIDEPMVGLDPRTVRTVKELMTGMVRDGRTVFMSTHTLEVAEAVADRIGIIHRGRLVAVGTLAELRSLASADASLEDIFLRLTEEPDDKVVEALPA